MQFKLLCLVALATGAIADDYTLDSIKEVHDATIKFKESLTTWDGSYVAGVKIAKQSRDLYNQLKNAAKPPPPEVKASQMGVYSVETEDEAFVVAQNLVREVGDTVDAAIANKEKMEAIIGGSTLDPSSLGTAWPDLALDENKDKAQDLAKQIDDHFARGKAVFA
ncbi:hypothetical protein PT974_09862 [Cladobotryum mycophilum]|uniref:Uncharacterized protein n=1 Tax=Cladobotryum mycophilum TaxID=491253 RepID=A0ABR0SIA1_9HYPO